MTLEQAIALLVIGAAGIFTTMWAIHRTLENRIRTMYREAINRPDTGHTAAVIRSRALDDEYRQLVAAEQSRTDD